jgi:aminoglycoside 2'-N-acetyltransferase I
LQEKPHGPQGPKALSQAPLAAAWEAGCTHADRLQRNSIWRGGLGHAAALLRQVWASHVLSELAWGDVTSSHADRRVLVWAADGVLASHVGLYDRDGTWNGTPIRFAGIGGVATRAEFRRQGFAVAALRHAAAAIRATDDADCGLLFCEPHNLPFYQRLGWHSVEGRVFALQPQGRGSFDKLKALVLDFKRAPRTGVFDVCGLPW